MYGKMMLIDKDTADQMLLHNTENIRKINYTNVEMYARDMKNGVWENNGEPIVFSKNGVLKNGQHRLMAISKSGVSVMMFVIFDVDDDVSIYDVGRNRTCGMIANTSSSQAGMARFLLALKEGNVRAYIGKGNVIDFLRKHSELMKKAESISRAGETHGIGKLAPCMAAIAILLRTGETEKIIRDFFEIINTGFPKEGYESSPAIVIRKLIQQNGAQGSENRKRLYSATIQAFYDFKNGNRRVKQYSIDEASFKIAKEISWEVSA